ncbi:hypothetical protein LWF15_01710 [Kineosporia rhizophila]|uniref:amylo-alpha-1,6-glucosidase n=1 Tax=Kineosporia rhizophila TaxID=84633 RepID=UPI001E560188|nr:glycogen debranching N-terminal domain-containing protein [Kineosporia rhizophila]MCE0534215.1 hypothetical protein [Kineosporia rhizophila]
MPSSEQELQPWLHDLVTTLCAPTTVLAEPSGQIRGTGAQGVLHSDVRVLRRALLRVNGEEPEPVGGGAVSAGIARFVSVPRALASGAVRIDRTRTVTAGEVSERIVLTSVSSQPVSLRVELELGTDLARVETFRAGRATEDAPASGGHPVRWGDGGARVMVSAPGAQRVDSTDPPHLQLCWSVELPPRGTKSLGWNLTASTEATPVIAPGLTSVLGRSLTVQADDHRIAALLSTSWSDLRALRMAPADDPSAVFLAAGSPWYFTLFGRDSIWAARFLLPFGTDLAEGTLRALAARQGTAVNPATAEEPGKIPHEIRSGTTRIGSMTLPPLYYGTVDATPLWICLLHDAWRWGLAEESVQALLPALEAALGWMQNHGDPDGDGFLEYLDRSGHGLANQGWKDSPDSVRFADGTIAEGPVALCEVQGYAYEAAVHGAALLEHFGRPDALFWRDWAQGLAERFRARFWVTRDDGMHFPALARDGAQRPVDSLTSNIGHLLGTGLLTAAESEHVAALLARPELSSGHGLRTMATSEGGYDPLSYHCGSVWAHDTAIAIHGLTRAGLGTAAFGLVEGLLAAGAGFGYRLPELYGGDPAGYTAGPLPYPTACRPQAWSAAAIGPIVQALAGLSAENGTLECLPPEGSPFGALEVSGLRFGREELTVSVERDGRGRLHPPAEGLRGSSPTA